MYSGIKYPTRKLGKNGPDVSAIGFGAMGIGSSFYGAANEEEAFAVLTYAADRGVTFWDTSDMYGTSETIIGNWFTTTGRRSEIFLATKFGAADRTPGSARPTYPNSKPSYIRKSIQDSLNALKTDYIDLCYQHRPDPEVPIEIVMETLKPYVEEGSVKWIGLSECNAKTLERATAVEGVGKKLAAVQMEFSPFELGIEKSGFAATARRLGVAVVAYSPLCRGLVGGRFRSRADFGTGDIRLRMPRFSEENFPNNIQLADKFAFIATRLNATPSQVALAWILAEHPDFFPIPGSKSIDRLEDNAKGVELKLSEEDVREIRKLAEEADVTIVGNRYHSLGMETTGVGCIPLSGWKDE